MDIIEKVENSGKLESPEEVRSYIFALHGLQFSSDDIVMKCELKDWSFKEGDVLKKKVIPVLVAMALAAPLDKTIESEAILYKREKEQMDKIEEPYRWLMYSLLMHSKFDNHPSGWIKYTPKMIDNILGHQSRLKTASMMNYCSGEHWLEFRVVGSKNPVTCYRVTFRELEDEEYARVESEGDIERLYKKIWEIIQ